MAQEAPKRARQENSGQKESHPDNEAAFTEKRTVDMFAPEKVLRFDDGGRYAVVLGKLQGQPALLQLEQKPALKSPDSVLAALSGLEMTLTNHSGAEYSYYDARPCPKKRSRNGGESSASTDGAEASATTSSPHATVGFAAEVIWPASARQIERKSPAAETVLVEETPAVYRQVGKSHALAQALRCQWIDQVLSLAKERERNLFHSERFVVNVDTKWATHGAPLSEDPAVRASWRGAPWTRDLYLLAIAQDPSLLSLRDLRGEEGARLCEDMRDELRRQAWEVYGVPATKLRIFFHYHPQFYRLHAHCASADFVVPGCEVERAHLLTDVAGLLRLGNGSFFAEQATLTYKVRVGEDLHKTLAAAGALMSNAATNVGDASASAAGV